jgi:hypothetical protein
VEGATADKFVEGATADKFVEGATADKIRGSQQLHMKFMAVSNC